MKAMLNTARDVIVSWRFLLNLVVILLITSWLPMLSQTVVMRDSDGNVMHESTVTSKLYQSWDAVLRMKPGMRPHLQAVSLHFGMCFAISFGVWYVTLHSRKRSVALETVSKDDKSPAEGEEAS